MSCFGFGQQNDAFAQFIIGEGQRIITFVQAKEVQTGPDEVLSAESVLSNRVWCLKLFERER